MKADSGDKVKTAGEVLESNLDVGAHSPSESGKAAEVLPVFQLKRILVPVDFSKCSLKALQYAIPFARQFGAELTLLHVISPAVVLQTSELAPQGISEATAAAKEGLEELRKTVGPEIASRSLVRNGSPHIAIIDAAKELDIDLIILSTHGSTGLRHVLLGSTVEKVVRRAGCPVLIVREHEHEFIYVADFSC